VRLATGAREEPAWAAALAAATALLALAEVSAFASPEDLASWSRVWVEEPGRPRVTDGPLGGVHEDPAAVRGSSRQPGGQG